MVAYLIFVGVLLPWKRLVKELEDDEEQTPDIIFATELFLLMGAQACIGYGSSKVCVFPLLICKSRVRVDMLLGQTKVNQVNDVSVRVFRPSHYKVGRFDVSVDKPSFVYIFDTRKHLKKNVTSYHLSKLLANVLFEVRNVGSFQVHDEEVLLILHVPSIHELVDLKNTLDSAKLSKELVLLLQYSFGLVWFLHLDCNFLLFDNVKSLMNG